MFGGAPVTERPARRPEARRGDTPPPKTGGDEKDVLVGFLDYLRSSIAAKAEGVPEAGLRASGVSSGTNLLGLIKHLTYVERFIFLGEHVPDWQPTFHANADETAEAVLSAYRDTTDRANRRIAACADLTEPAHASAAKKRSPSMRWALVHLIEETGRHAGHADILRELLDDTTGR